MADITAVVGTSQKEQTLTGQLSSNTNSTSESVDSSAEKNKKAKQCVK